MRSIAGQAFALSLQYCLLVEETRVKKFFADIKYIFIYTWKIDKLYLLLRLPSALLESLMPFINVIFPALIVEDLTIYMDYGRVIRHAAYMAVLLIVSHTLKNILQMLITNRYNLFEYKHAITLGRKIMSVTFPETENPETLNLVERIRRIGYIERTFESVFSFLSSTVTVIGMLWILSNVNFLIIITIFLAVVLNVYFSSKSKKYNYEWQKETAPFRRRNEYLLRLMYGFQYGKEVRVNGLQEYLTEKYSSHSIEYMGALKKVTYKFLKMNTGTSTVNSVQQTIVYLSLASAVLAKSITIASFTKYISAVNSLTSTLLRISNAFVELRNNFNYVDNLRTFLALETEEEKGNLPVPGGQFLIEFKNVSFRYPNTDRYVLEDINVSIAPGSQVAIVGLNGSGKTTFVKLMLGLYKPTQGMICVNGVDISKLDFKEYIKNFACAFQDYRLFSYPVRENIVFVQDYNEEKLDDVVKKCGIYDAINKLPKKKDTPIFKFLDDSGVEFSGGEGQKIAIARAIYKDAGVVVLDEPLAALDPIAEYEMYRSLSGMTDGRTCIFISHCLSLAQKSDQILVFSQGKIAELGTHAELVGRENGLYAEMYKKQAVFYQEGDDTDGT